MLAIGTPTGTGNPAVPDVEILTPGFTQTGTVSLSATQASGRVALPATGSLLVIRNYGSSIAYVKLGTVAVSAAVTDYPIDPYSYDVLARTVASETYLAAICNTGQTASLSISAGNGSVVQEDYAPSFPAQVSLQSVPTVSVSTLSNVASSASNVTLLAANTSRKGLVIMNDSTAILYIKFGATASATSFTYKLSGGETFEMPMSPIYTGIVDGIWASANGSARVTELT